MDQDGIHRLLTPAEITRLNGLAVGSRFTVEGALQGAHRSLLKGFSLEFADYRQYTPGDDLRRLDWRVLGRTDKLYLRQHEQECNLRVHLLVDASRSMAYSGDPARPSKYRHAARLAAALAYLTVFQQDSVALTLFDTRVRDRLPLGAGAEHLRRLANRLADAEPAAATDIPQTLHSIAGSLRRRALVVLFSDLLDNLDPLRHALAHFRRRHHDVIVYHILDPAEREFPFHDDAAFEDLETGALLTVDPRELRNAYRARFDAFLNECRALTAALNVDYQPVSTDTPPETTLRRHLTTRRR
ncbi:MAG: DUF58 domain-containing protein [Lentisphaeria bacterium]